MRRIYPLTFMALSTLLCMTACSSSDDTAADPNVSPNEAVKTSFTLSVGLPQGNTANAKPSTRVSDDVAQASSNFRGIDNISLIPFNGEVRGSSSRLGGSNITLPNSPNNSLPSGQLAETGNSKVYNDVEIPLTTDHFLFYGKAVDASAGTDITSADQKFQYGTIVKAGLDAGAPSGITFTPSPIYTATSLDNAVATSLVTYLNRIVQTSYTTSGETTGTSTWADYAAGHAKGNSFATLYTRLTGLVSGSSVSVKDAVQELYTSLVNLNAADLTTDEQNLRTAIEGNILDAAYASAGTSGTTLTFTAALNGYPGNINLPDGAASLTFDADSKTFSQNSGSHTLANGMQVAAFNNYAYPVNLWYFANTPIKTSGEALSDQYSGKTWDEVLNLYGSANGTVSAATRSIALVNPIQYAVGRLQTVVKAADRQLLDKNGEAVTVGETTFPVTGILIGGQRQVNWQFKPVSATTGSQYTLYDKVADNTIYATTSNTKANQTLALETPEGADGKINVVVELQNNSGQQFTGANGVIPAGSKFYLVAELDPTNTNHAGNPTGVNQVFLQDYVTTANLTINKNEATSDNQTRNKGLGAAYNVIPDLRTPVLSIGMSVDLTWQSGLTFDVDM